MLCVCGVLCSSMCLCGASDYVRVHTYFIVADLMKSLLDNWVTVETFIYIMTDFLTHRHMYL